MSAANSAIEAGPKPVPLRPSPENIPEELKALPHWVVWRYRYLLKKGKWTKPPFRIDGNGCRGHASSTDPDTWSNFSAALTVYQNGSVDGIGVALTPDMGIVGVDLDHCYNRETRTFEPWATAVIEHFNSYTEASPGGTGVRIFLRGKLPAGGRKKGNIEIYSSGRYLTVTGRVLKKDLPRAIEPRQEEIDSFLAEHFPPESKAEKSAGANDNRHIEWNPTDEELLDKAFAARNGGRIQALFNGDISAYPSQSEADQALCSLLAFWTQDQAQLDGLFRRSALMRDKWDERHGGQTYGERTIQKAISGITETYSGKTNRGAVNTNRPAEPNRLTDLGNARRFAQMHKGNVLYSAQRRKWLLWTGQRWEWDLTGAILDLAVKTVQSFYAEAACSSEKEQREALSAHALKSEARGKIDAMLALAQALPEIRTDLERFDRDPFLFNCPNVTIDLRTGKGREHRREDYITKMSPTSFDPLAKCPVFENFLADVTLREKTVQEFIQRAAGYSATGDVREHILFLSHGSGFNGKSTLVNGLADTMGSDYAKEIKAEILMESRDSKDAYLAELVGVRMVLSLESDRDRKLSVGLIKTMTGGDKISCCRKYENPFSFMPEFKVWFGTNHKPKINDTTNSIWFRLKPIPFEACFPPEDPKTDKKLPEKLHAEVEGILAWMVRGCLDWLANGLPTPPTVKEANDSYRQEQDIIGAFIQDRCILDSGATETIKALYEAYSHWCGENGEEAESQRAFGNLLTESGIAPDRKSTARIRRGLCLVTRGNDDA